MEFSSAATLWNNPTEDYGEATIATTLLDELIGSTLSLETVDPEEVIPPEGGPPNRPRFPPSNHNDPKEVRKRRTTIISVMTLDLVILVGNLMVVIAVARYRFLRTPLNLLLVSLSLVNLKAAVMTPINLYLAYTYNDYGLNLVLLKMDACLFSLWTMEFAMKASVLCVFVVTVERLLAVQWPKTHASWVTMKTAGLAVVLTWVVSILLSLPAIAGWNNWQFLRCTYFHVYTDFHLYGLSATPLFGLLAAAGVIQITVVMITKNSRQWNTKDEKSTNKKIELGLTRMVNAIVVFLFIGWVPALGMLVHFIKTEFTDYKDLSNVYTGLRVLTLISQMVYPLILSKRNPDFKRGFRMLRGRNEDNVVAVTSVAETGDASV